MENAYVLKGRLDESGLLQIAERLPLPAGEVEVIVRPVRHGSRPGHSIWDVVDSSPFHRPAEELLAHLRSLRDEWER